MIIIYNPKRLFSKAPKHLLDTIIKKIYSLAEDIAGTDQINQNVIKKYNIDKITSTKDVFKFYLPDGYRCLFRYQSFDDEIFEGESVIVLYEIVEHDLQGKKGRNLKLESDFREFSKVEILDNEVSESFDYEIQNKFMHKIHVPTRISFEDFLAHFQHPEKQTLYPLSENQRKALDDSGPILLLGCAGSGKTLVLISRALKEAQHGGRQGYFTFTKMLKESALKIYQKYQGAKGIEGDVEFYVIKDFMLDILNLSETQYFSFERYLYWYQENRFDQKYKWLRDVGPIDLWIEIRGLIKGYAGNEYLRIKTIDDPSKYLSKTEIKELKALGIIKKLKDSYQQYEVANEKELFKYLEDDGHPLRRYFQSLDRDTPLMSQKDYVDQMYDKYTEYDQSTRKSIYDFVENVYQPYLNNEERTLYDDNDLARMLIKSIDHRNIQKMDYVYIDEIQDLTEMQIIALAKLSEHSSDVFMSGDVSQIINPTFFKKGRIGLLFRNRFNTVLNQNLALDENYRNSESIVEISRKLLTIRQDILGEYNEDIKERSTRLEKDEGIPYMLDINQETAIEQIRHWLNVPKVAVIVASEKTKKDLLERFSIKGQTNIYTVQEIKGQEFDKTILYNVLTEHHQAWTDIMNRNIEKTRDIINRHRYYFNLFYVSLTRSIDNVFLYENHKDLAIYEAIKDDFEILDSNLELLMDINHYDSVEERKKQAEIHFHNEDYDRARTYFLQLNDRHNAAICTGHVYINQGRYLEGVMHLYPFKKYHEKAFKYTNDKDLLAFKVLLGYWTRQLRVKEISDMLRDKSLIELIKPFKREKIYNKLLLDAMRVNDHLYRYRIQKEITSIEKGESYGTY